MSPAEKLKAVLAAAAALKGLTSAMLTVPSCTESEVVEAAAQLEVGVTRHVSTGGIVDPAPTLIFSCSKTIDGVYITLQGHRDPTPGEVMDLKVTHYPPGEPLPTDAALALLKPEAA